METIIGKQFSEKVIPEIMLRNENWFSDAQPEEILAAQYRYHGPLIEGTLFQEKHVFQPKDALQETPASGQSLVLYRGDECIGGGIIV